ncbi:MAG: cation diffusion facilitator family transporter [Candidatus Levybacteria bacterium]|nr:cation diffusion facilitator family transporter [Candidatus Levybacteria bacterium]
MDKRKKTVALSSVFASLFLTILKLAVGLSTGSIGIISEAAHSGLDLAAAFITYLAVRISGQPADIAHHYGHGKAESVSALIETGLLLLTSVWIVYEAVGRLSHKSVEIEVTWYAFAVMAISIIIDYSRSKALHKVAMETKSQALEADALHFKTDIYSSAVVMAGLFFVTFGAGKADAFAAMGVAVFVVFASIRLGKRTINVLMDAAPIGLTQNVSNIAIKVDGVVEVERVRVRPAGASFFIDMVVKVSRKASLEQVEKITKNIEKNLQIALPDADVIVNVKPVAVEGETLAEQIGMIARNHGGVAHDIHLNVMDGRKSVNFNLEVDNKLTLDEAHKTATVIENAIINELGKDVDVNTHIEPMSSESVSRKVSKKEMDTIYCIAHEVRKTSSSVKNIHNVSVQNVHGKLFISLHCVFGEKTSIIKVHNQSRQIENLFKEKMPNIEKVFIHTEPPNGRFIP